MASVRVAELSSDDMPELIEVLDAIAVKRARPGVPQSEVSARLARHLMEAGQGRLRAVVARKGQRIVGLMTMSVDDSFGLVADGGIRVHVIHVVDSARHRGVGAAMLVEAIEWADEVGEVSIVVEVHDGSRDVKRWLSKLGFGSELSLRSASVDGLRRRLGHAGTPASGRRVRQGARAAFRSRSAGRASRLAAASPVSSTGADPQARNRAVGT